MATHGKTFTLTESFEKTLSLTVIIPCYNEVSTLEDILQEVEAIDLADEILPYQNSRRGVFVGFKDIYDNLTPTTTSVITGGSYEAENKDYNYVKGMYILTRFGDVSCGLELLL